ncbi:unnamed protein product [Agarophyton chilense]
MTDASSLLAMWRLRLSECDYEITYRPGSKHQTADALSRIITDGTDDTPLDDLIPTAFTDDGPQDYTETYDLMGTVQSEEPEVKKNEVYLLDWETVPPISARPQVNAITPEEKELLPVTIEELLQAQVEDEYCKEPAQLVVTPGCLFDYDRFGLLCRHSPLDGALERVIPTSLRAGFLYLPHFPHLAGHPGCQKMYQTLRKFFHWSQMAQDLWKTARNCASCAQIRGSRADHQAKLKLFPAAGPMESVAMDMLGPLLKTSHGKRFVLVITDRFTNLTRALPVGKTTATDVATAFLSHWVYPYGMLLYLLTDNGSQLVSQFFSHVCQAERFNRILLYRLAQYVSEHQLDWDDYVEPPVYADNTQLHASTGKTPFDLTLTIAPLPIAVDLQESIIPQDITEGMAPTQAKHYSRRRIDRILQSARTVLTKAQRRYKSNLDKAVWNTPTFGKRDLVYLDRSPKDSEELEDTTRKLLTRSTGTQKVLKANEHTITLLIEGLQDTVSIDSVTRAPSSSGQRTSQPRGSTEAPRPQIDTQVSIPFKAVPEDSTSPTDTMVNANCCEPSLPTGSDGFAPLDHTLLPEDEHQPKYVIERIISAGMGEDGTMHYRVRWFGYKPEEDTWQEPQTIPANFIARFWRRICHWERGLLERATIGPNNPTIGPNNPKTPPKPPPDTKIRRSTTVRRSFRIREQSQYFGDT